MRRRTSRGGAARAASAPTPDDRLVNQIIEASGYAVEFVEFINRIGRGQSKHPHPSGSCRADPYHRIFQDQAFCRRHCILRSAARNEALKS
jgi:hypothetical protein